MLAFESMRVEERHAVVPGFPQVLAHKEMNTFGEFLNEFTGGSWVPPSEGGISDCLSTSSTCSNGDEDCQSSCDPEEMITEGRCVLKPGSTAAGGLANTQFSTLQWRSKYNTTDGESPSSPSRRTDVLDSPQQRHPRPPAEETCSPSLSAPDESSGSTLAHKNRSNLFPTKRTLAHVSFRTLTNATYLRRMHLSKEDAIGLFPKMRESIEHVFPTDMKRRASLGSMKIPTTVFIQDDKGRRWPIVLECLRTAGQRHIRINQGWAAVCSANSLSVGKCVRFERWEEASQAVKEAVVTVTML